MRVLFDGSAWDVVEIGPRSKYEHVDAILLGKGMIITNGVDTIYVLEQDVDYVD